MAVARMVCGDCGAEVSFGDRHCAQCGAPLESGLSASAPVPPGKATIRCEVCGHENSPGASYCESCGARCTGGSPVTLPNTPPRQKQEAVPKDRKKKPGARTFEPWQVAAGIGIAALVAFFVYTEMVRETPKGEAHVHADPPTVSVQEIERLQAEADARPSDAPTLLRLANILHDNAMRDSRFLLRAIETYKKYLNLQPANPDARVDLGICYFELGRVDSTNSRSLFSQAIREMETAFRSSPTHQPAAFNLGIVNLNAGNLEESNRWMKKTVELNQQSELGQRAQRILEQHSFQ